jgi:iron complex transport system substrate-binding protein
MTLGRTFAVAMALALSGAVATAASQPSHAGPRHIMSINLCTDELLLELVPPERIASVTFLSRDPSESFLWRQAAHVAINHGQVEEMLAEKPDLVLAGTSATPQMRSFLKRLGAPLVEVGLAESFDAVRVVTRQVAQAVGEPARGDELLRRMDATLHQLSATRPRQVIRIAAWDGSGYVPGKGSLFDAILTAAGGTNIASSTQGAGSGSFDIEQLLAARPDILAYGSDSGAILGRRMDADQHPLILKLYASRRVTYPEALYSCGVPQSADAARALRAAMLSVMARKGPAP